jgi:ATP-binding cassette, subfamily B (MDR/TAP), member 1
MASEKTGVSTAPEIVIEEERPTPSFRGLYRFCTNADLALLIPAIIASVGSGLLIPAFTILLGKIFTSFGSFSTGQIPAGELEKQATPFVIGICVVGAAAWAFGWAHMALWLAFGENTARRARERVMKGLLQKNMAWYDKRVVDNGVSGSMNKAVKYHPT